MLNFTSLLFLGVLVWSSDSAIVQSRKFTNYGEWHSMEYCPDGMYAMGVNIKFDKDMIDITALNGVAFYCEPLNSPSYTHKHRITSGVGPFGEWTHFDSTQYCPQDKLIVGFYLYSKPITIADDTGAIQFTGLCGYPFGSRDPSTWKLEDKVISDLPMYKYLCPEGYAINGIQTQVESAQDMGDDTGLNNINVNCHEIILSCTHEFITLFDYSNSGSTPVSQSYTERIAYTHKSSQTYENSTFSKLAISTKISRGIQIGTEISAGIKKGNLADSINGEIGIGYEKVTTENLISMVESTFHREREETVGIQIPPKSHTIIKQLHIVCGNYRVSLPKTMRKEYPSSSPRAGFELFTHFCLLFLAYIAFDIIST